MEESVRFRTVSHLVDNLAVKRNGPRRIVPRPFRYVEPSGYQGLRAIGRLSLNYCRVVYWLAEGGQKGTAPLILDHYGERLCRV